MNVKAGDLLILELNLTLTPSFLFGFLSFLESSKSDLVNCTVKSVGSVFREILTGRHFVEAELEF